MESSGKQLMVGGVALLTWNRVAKEGRKEV